MKGYPDEAFAVSKAGSAYVPVLMELSQLSPGLENLITRPGSASGDTIMLTSLSQFQAQGWEKWLSRITFTGGTDTLKSRP